MFEIILEYIGLAHIQTQDIVFLYKNTSSHNSIKIFSIFYHFFIFCTKTMVEGYPISVSNVE